MARLDKCLLAGLACMPLLGACRDKPKAVSGAACSDTRDCQAGLVCEQEVCRPAAATGSKPATPAEPKPTEAANKCQQSKACQASDVCVPWGDKCGWEAKTPADCMRQRGNLRISPCRHFGRCTVKGGVCVAASDADCAKGKQCEIGGACTAVEGICKKKQ